MWYVEVVLPGGFTIEQTYKNEDQARSYAMRKVRTLVTATVYVYEFDETDEVPKTPLTPHPSPTSRADAVRMWHAAYGS